MYTLVNYRPMLTPETFDRVYRAPRSRTAFALPVDVRAEGDDYILIAAVPGLKADDVNIEVLGERVTISADIPAPEADEKATWLMNERRYGSFSRTLNFPVELDSTHAEARVADGVLTLRLPKAEVAKPKVIKVSAK